MNDDSIDSWVEKDWIKPKFPEKECMQESFPSHTITFCGYYRGEKCPKICSYAKKMDSYGGNKNGNKKER